MTQIDNYASDLSPRSTLWPPLDDSGESSHIVADESFLSTQ